LKINAAIYCSIVTQTENRAAAWQPFVRLKDTIAQQRVALLRKYGDIIMVTGDDEASAERVARETGIASVWTNHLPEQKLALVHSLQAQGRKVAMSGVGVNDAVAIAAAHVGIVMDSGTDSAMRAGDVILACGSLSRAAEAISLSRASMRNIRQNLGSSFLYNAVVFPLASAGLLDPRAVAAIEQRKQCRVEKNVFRTGIAKAKAVS
jgi:Cu+-exporting ATPase